jgi:peptidoglycan/LPS O-acetylase OafA/YrhL
MKGSAFLDLTRTLAALAVFLAHYSYDRFSGGVWEFFQPYAHSAVVVFFVLSGYVIAWTAGRDGWFSRYAINRAARIFSVAVPALLLTWAIDMTVNTQAPAYQLAQPWKYLPLFLTFTTDWWFISENAFSNAPYWSLSYEVWYYAVFGLAVFGRRWLAVILLLAMGPRHWLLFPIWLFGAWLYRSKVSIAMPRVALVAALGLIVALKGFAIDTALNEMVNDLSGGWAKENLRYSQYFLGDYLFALLVGVMIIAARDADLPLPQKPIAAVASVSFSLYLTHYPLLILFSIWTNKNPVAVFILTLGAVVLFALAFERQKVLVRNALAKVIP